MEVNVMKSLQNLTSKIKGSLYGFAIGDAMGATTEFMDEVQIKKLYGKVDNIIGGGWLHLKAGEVTDDTQMTMCVCEAIEYGYGKNRQWSAIEFRNSYEAMLTKCCYNFSQWYLSNPPDIGNCCRKVISQCLNNRYFDRWMKVADDPNTLGNGSLMRTMPIVLAGLGCQAALSQGRLTHNNKPCDYALEIYYNNMEELLYHDTFRNSTTQTYEPTGHVLNTLNNALYWAQHTDSLEQAIIKAVNHGGDADTIAAITGSMAGALYGYEAIPQRWIEQLDPKVKADLDRYTELFIKLLEKNVKKVCTNLE